MTTALILFLVILLFSLLFADPGWSNVLSTTRNDVVFAHRNKAYGAYRIRQEHHRVMVMAFATATGLVAGGFAIPSLLTAGSFTAPTTFLPRGTEVIFEEFPVEPPVTPPTPPVPPVDPKVIDTRDPNEMAVVLVDSIADEPTWVIDTTNTSASIASGAGIPGGLPTPDPNPGGGTSIRSSGGGDGSGTHYKHGWELDEQPEFPGGVVHIAGEDALFVALPERGVEQIGVLAHEHFAHRGVAEQEGRELYPCFDLIS